MEGTELTAMHSSLKIVRNKFFEQATFLSELFFNLMT